MNWVDGSGVMTDDNDNKTHVQTRTRSYTTLLMVKENVRVRVRVREGYSTNEQSYDGTADVARRENGRTISSRQHMMVDACECERERARALSRLVG